MATKEDFRIYGFKGNLPNVTCWRVA